METKQFKAESKRLLDLMINSIYTHREIFLRELISNASDAIDKIYYKALVDDSISFNKDNYFIKISLDKASRTIKISDTGIGMTKEELDDNLGVIAKSGSLKFKKENESCSSVNNAAVLINASSKPQYNLMFRNSELATTPSSGFLA